MAYGVNGFNWAIATPLTNILSENSTGSCPTSIPCRNHQEMVIGNTWSNNCRIGHPKCLNTVTVLSYSMEWWGQLNMDLFGWDLEVIWISSEETLLWEWIWNSVFWWSGSIHIIPFAPKHVHPDLCAKHWVTLRGLFVCLIHCVRRFEWDEWEKSDPPFSVWDLTWWPQCFFGAMSSPGSVLAKTISIF